MFDGKGFSDYLDCKINSFIKYYANTNNDCPDFMLESEWEAVLNKMIEVSDNIVSNNKRLRDGILISNSSNNIKDLATYIQNCDVEISHIEAESFALRESLFKMINEYWAYLN